MLSPLTALELHPALSVFPRALVTKARENVADGTCAFLVLSGWMGSGKDSVAPAVLERMGHAEGATHMYYALPLKTEMDDILAVLRYEFGSGRTLEQPLTDADRAAAAELVAYRFKMPVAHAHYFTGDLLDAALTDPDLHARSRDQVMRRSLQLLGTEVRRAQDENYWVKKALAPTLQVLASGQTVFVTDARFPNEIEAAQSALGFATRLDITRETQERRIAARDGEGVLTEEARNHESETALDDYAGFDLRFLNEGTLDEAVDRIVAAWPHPLHHAA